MQIITIPQLGESVTEVVIAHWIKQVGDSVEQYEPIVEVITDKVNIDVSSDYAGILKEVLVKEGESVAPGTVIALLDSEDGK